MWVRGINVKVVLVARRRNVFGKKSCPSTLDQVLSGSGVGTVSVELTIACFSLWRERERESGRRGSMWPEVGLLLACLARNLLVRRLSRSRSLDGW
jgi:hypothetical protein